MFFSRVYGFDIGEVDVGVVEWDKVNRVQMVGLVDVERFVIEWRWRWSMVHTPNLWCFLPQVSRKFTCLEKYAGL